MNEYVIRIHKLNTEKHNDWMQTISSNLDTAEVAKKIVEDFSIPIELPVSQENGEHPLHTFRAKDGRFKYTSLASRKIHNDIVYTLANRLEQFVSEHIRTETQ